MATLTKEEIQKRIDHYGAVADAMNQVNETAKAAFYQGKRDAYCDLYNELYPVMLGERAYSIDEEAYQKDIDFNVFVHKSAKPIK